MAVATSKGNNGGVQIGPGTEEAMQRTRGKRPRELVEQTHEHVQNSGAGRRMRPALADKGWNSILDKACDSDAEKCRNFVSDIDGRSYDLAAASAPSIINTICAPVAPRGLSSSQHSLSVPPSPRSSTAAQFRNPPGSCGMVSTVNSDGTPGTSWGSSFASPCAPRQSGGGPRANSQGRGHSMDSSTRSADSDGADNAPREAGGVPNAISQEGDRSPEQSFCAEDVDDALVADSFPKAATEVGGDWPHLPAFTCREGFWVGDAAQHLEGIIGSPQQDAELECPGNVLEAKTSSLEGQLSATANMECPEAERLRCLLEGETSSPWRHQSVMADVEFQLSKSEAGLPWEQLCLLSDFDDFLEQVSLEAPTQDAVTVTASSGIAPSLEPAPCQLSPTSEGASSGHQQHLSSELVSEEHGARGATANISLSGAEDMPSLTPLETLPGAHFPEESQAASGCPGLPSLQRPAQHQPPLSDAGPEGPTFALPGRLSPGPPTSPADEHSRCSQWEEKGHCQATACSGQAASRGVLQCATPLDNGRTASAQLPHCQPSLKQDPPGSLQRACQQRTSMASSGSGSHDNLPARAPCEARSPGTPMSRAPCRGASSQVASNHSSSVDEARPGRNTPPNRPLLSETAMLLSLEATGTSPAERRMVQEQQRNLTYMQQYNLSSSCAQAVQEQRNPSFAHASPSAATQQTPIFGPAAPQILRAPALAHPQAPPNPLTGVQPLPSGPAPPLSSQAQAPHLQPPCRRAAPPQEASRKLQLPSFCLRLPQRAPPASADATVLNRPSTSATATPGPGAEGLGVAMEPRFLGSATRKLLLEKLGEQLQLVSQMQAIVDEQTVMQVEIGAQHKALVKLLSKQFGTTIPESIPHVVLPSLVQAALVMGTTQSLDYSIEVQQQAYD